LNFSQLSVLVFGLASLGNVAAAQAEVRPSPTNRLDIEHEASMTQAQLALQTRTQPAPQATPPFWLDIGGGVGGTGFGTVVQASLLSGHQQISFRFSSFEEFRICFDVCDDDPERISSASLLYGLTAPFKYGFLSALAGPGLHIRDNDNGRSYDTIGLTGQLEAFLSYRYVGAGLLVFSEANLHDVLPGFAIAWRIGDLRTRPL